MSIKSFHILFIVIAALFSGSFGVWAAFFTGSADGVTAKVFGGLSLVAAVSLLIYAVYFYRKAKNIII